MGIHETSFTKDEHTAHIHWTIQVVDALKP
jgi:hypothetical protein